MGQYSPAKTGEYPRIFPNFQNRARCEKDLKDNKHNSLHLGRKYVRIFVLGHYLFLVAHSFPRATLSENCSLLGTDNFRGQISWHIFAPNGGYCLYKNIFRNIFRNIFLFREIQVFRNENSSQTNAYLHYFNYSYSGLIPNERALNYQTGKPLSLVDIIPAYKSKKPD